MFLLENAEEKREGTAMRLPAGQRIAQEKNLAEIDFPMMLYGLIEEEHTGYVVVTSKTELGIEEGLIILRQGVIAGSYFEFMKFDVTFYGEKALPHVFNAVKAEKGIVEVYSISMHELDLVTAFNEDLKVEKEYSQRDLENMAQESYNLELSEEALKDKISKGATKHDLLMGMGLGSLTE